MSNMFGLRNVSSLSYEEENKFAAGEEYNISVPGLWVVCWLTLVEYGVLWCQKKPLPPLHENVLSLSHSVFFVMSKIFLHTFEKSVYFWIWTNYCLWPDLFSDTFLSFAVTVLLIDFGYYWFHRASHEIMLFWAIHQVHHSSYDMTFSVGLRHSPLQTLFSWVFSAPLALIGIPPAHLMLHIELSYLYQVMTHTCTLEKLGPLEWVLNTPSHHRVHHGSTLECLDKNYGGLFIFWDFIFGTFKPELPEEESLFGLVYQPNFWNILHHQVFYLKGAFDKAKQMPNWRNFVETFIKGPSWLPGLNWTGRNADNADFNAKLVRTRMKANSSDPINVYAVLHVLAVLVLLSSVAENKRNENLFAAMSQSLFILIGLVNISVLYEGASATPLLETCRCAVGLFLCLNLPVSSSLAQLFLLFIYSLSFFVWTVYYTSSDIKFGSREQFDKKTE